ncbi:MAG: hypothetical protein AB8F94_01015 [Saprospiraceae bacterium]
MKILNIVSLVILSLIFSCNKDDNTIYEGTVNISSVEQLVEFNNLLKGKTEITGSVNISDLINPDLSVFENIQKIGFQLTIVDSELFDLSFFSNLEEVKTVALFSNQISSLNGLENLTSVEGIQIEHNSPSLNIDAIQNINASSFFILSGISSTIPVFPNIVEVGGIDLTELSAITDYSFLPNLKTSTLLITIGGSENGTSNVTSLNGLEQLTAIETLYIVGHENLDDISSLENIISGSEIKFTKNEKLSDYCPLKSILSDGDILFSAIGNLENPTKSEIITDCP